MKPEQYRDILLLVANAMMSLRWIDLPGAIEAIGKAERFGAMPSSTLCQNNWQKTEGKKMLEAALPLWRLANAETK